MEIVRVEEFSFAYPASVTPDKAGAKEQGSPQPDRGGAAYGEAVLDGVSLSVEEGAFCVLVGATGSGKTTLLRALKPELAPAGSCAGSIAVCGRALVRDGVRVCDMSPLESAASIGFVMQDPGMQIVCDTVWHELAFGLENIGTPPDEMRRRVAEVAHFFGIEPWIRSRTETLSGGQQQLVNLAAVLALRPSLLLLDEPTAQLDPNALKHFLFMLSRVNRELGITVIMATHSPEDTAPYATQVVSLGESVQPASRERVEEALAPRRAERSSRVQAAEPCICVREAYYRFARTEPWVLRGVNAQVKQGSVHAFVGGNGCGKTTLMRVMAGALKPQRGSVDNRMKACQALLPQNPKALFVCDTVLDELREWQGRCAYADADIDAALERFGLAECASRHPYDVSGGQQQRLALAKLLLCRPRLLFLDEPTKGLDPAACADTAHIVARLAEQGCTVVLVTHDLDFALLVADEVTMLFDGEDACTESVGAFFGNNVVYRPNSASRLFGEACRALEGRSRA